jgi:hypothetical protein
MKAMLAFILDQILQFWPPYRQEQDAEVRRAMDHAEAREPVRQTQQTADSAAETDDPQQRMARRR